MALNFVPSASVFLLKHKECGKLGENNWLVSNCDYNGSGPSPTDGEKGERMEGVEKKEPNSISNKGSPNSTKALEQSIFLSKEDSNRKKVISILMETKIKEKKKKKEERNRDKGREGLHSTGSCPPQPKKCFLSPAQENMTFLL